MGLSKELRLVRADAVEHPGAFGVVLDDAVEVLTEVTQGQLAHAGTETRGEERHLCIGEMNARARFDQRPEPRELRVRHRALPGGGLDREPHWAASCSSAASLGSMGSAIASE